MAEENNCDILYCEKGFFLPTENIISVRFVCKKKLLPYYEQSENYSKYKHIIPKMTTCSMESYQDMNKMNIILEKHNIKYVALAGTILGLNRHGGIIPWDNDIDIGFTENDYKKLFSIKDELEQNGFNCRIISSNHCHFGSIDCFKLKLNGDYYEGGAKTYCSLEEYQTITKQIFGYTYIYAPFCSKNSLTKRYGNYFNEGNVNDNFHFKDKSVSVFNLNYNDLSYQIK
jgi:hypothetical protein